MLPRTPRKSRRAPCLAGQATHLFPECETECPLAEFFLLRARDVAPSPRVKREMPTQFALHRGLARPAKSAATARSLRSPGERTRTSIRAAGREFPKSRSRPLRDHPQFASALAPPHCVSRAAALRRSFFCAPRSATTLPDFQ